MDMIGNLIERGQGDQDEGPFRQPGMRNGQLWCLHHQVAKEEDVDVDRTGSVAAARSPPQLGLDPIGQGQKPQRRQPGADLADAVEEAGLVGIAHGLGIVCRGDLQYLCSL